MALRILSPEQAPVPTPAAGQKLRYSLVLVPDGDADAFARQLEEIVSLTDDDMYDVIVVNRGRSPLVSRLLLQLEGDVDVLEADSSVSWAWCCNHVASQITGDRLVFVSTDARFYPGWLRYIDEQCRANPDLAVVRSADSNIISVRPDAFARLRGFNIDSETGREIDDFCVYAASRGERISYDRVLATGPSKLRWKYMTDGYVKLEGFLDPDLCDRIIAEGEAYYASQGVNPYDVNRVMNFHQVSPTAQEHLTGERFMAVLREAFAEDPLFLQTILFYEGSQQNLHSDWIYMSTDRHHRLMGTWMALEDVTDDAGPLRYLPGSQNMFIESIPERWARLRPEFEEQMRNGTYRRLPGYAEHNSDAYLYVYDGWEGEIGPAAHALGYKEERFLAKKGDVLLWHANLVHGGTKIERPGATRRSIVAHYLTKEINQYFDINHPNGVVTSAEVAAHNPFHVQPDLWTKQRK